MSDNLHKFDNSSSIEHVDYYDHNNTMEIRFSSGAVYHYPNCDKEHYDELKTAASPGKHFHQHIRKLKANKVSG